MTTLRGERVTLRPVAEADADALLAMLREPDVRRWWGEYDADRVRRDLYDDDDTEVFAIEVEGRFAGVLQWWEEKEPDYRHAGIDLSLVTAQHGRGIGREALRLAVDHLIRERGHHRFTIDPDAGNERAIRCYASVGFRPVGIMRRYARVDGRTWRDGLLMDLLADDL